MMDVDPAGVHDGLNYYVWDDLPFDSILRPPSIATNNSGFGCKFASVSTQCEYEKKISQARMMTPLGVSIPKISFDHQKWRMDILAKYPNYKESAWTPYDLMLLMVNDDKREHIDQRRIEGIGLSARNNDLIHWADDVQKIDSPSAMEIEEQIIRFKRPLVATISTLHCPKYAESAYEYTGVEDAFVGDTGCVVLVGVHYPTQSNNPYSLNLNLDPSRRKFIYQTSYPDPRSGQPLPESMMSNGMGIIDSKLVLSICYTLNNPPAALLQTSPAEYMVDSRYMEANKLEDVRSNNLFLLQERRRGCLPPIIPHNPKYG